MERSIELGVGWDCVEGLIKDVYGIGVGLKLLRRRDWLM